MAAQDNNSAAAAVSGFFKSIGGFFADFGTAVVKGDAFGWAQAMQSVNSM